jgi:acyl carrier protein
MDRFALVRRVFRDVLDDESLEISAASTRADIDGWDSVVHVKVVLALESELAVRFKTDDVMQVRSVGDLVVMLETLLP